MQAIIHETAAPEAPPELAAVRAVMNEKDDVPTLPPGTAEAGDVIVTWRPAVNGGIGVEYKPRKRELADRLARAEAQAAAELPELLQAEVRAWREGPEVTRAGALRGRVGELRAQLAEADAGLDGARGRVAEEVADGRDGAAAGKKLDDMVRRRDRLAEVLPAVERLAVEARGRALAELRRRSEAKIAEYRAANGHGAQAALLTELAAAVAPFAERLRRHRGRAAAAAGADPAAVLKRAAEELPS